MLISVDFPSILKYCGIVYAFDLLQSPLHRVQWEADGDILSVLNCTSYLKIERWNFISRCNSYRQRWTVWYRKIFFSMSSSLFFQEMIMILFVNSDPIDETVFFSKCKRNIVYTTIDNGKCFGYKHNQLISADRTVQWIQLVHGCFPVRSCRPRPCLDPHSKKSGWLLQLCKMSQNLLRLGPSGGAQCFQIWFCLVIIFIHVYR